MRIVRRGHHRGEFLGIDGDGTTAVAPREATAAASRLAGYERSRGDHSRRAARANAGRAPAGLIDGGDGPRRSLLSFVMVSPSATGSSG